MLLTIGMIVKDEEKYLGSCLEALKPILEKVDSELIIVDTGSTDSTVDIAKKFTDKVFHFEWCDDFSAARNAAMKRAKGSWYMSVDADEIIKDAGDLIDFFNTGEYKKYNAASFVIRSYNDADSKIGSDFNAIRLIKISKDSFYEGKVHEHFERIYEPIKHIKIVADHYGYVTKNNREYIEYKNRRNLKLVLAELEKNPKSSILYLYICQTYRILNENDKAMDYADKGIEVAKEQNDPVLYSLFSNKLGMYMQSNKHAEAVETADKYFSLKKKEVGTDLEFYFGKAKSCYMLKMYKEAAVLFIKYLKFYDEFKRGLHRTIDTFQHSLSYTSYTVYRTAVLMLASSLIETEQYADASRYLHMVPISDFISENTSESKDLINLKFLLMKKTEDYSDIVPLYNLFRQTHEILLCEHIENALRSGSDRDALLKQFSGYDEPGDAYGGLLRLRYYYYTGLLNKRIAESFIDGIEDFAPLYADAVYIAAGFGVSIDKISEKVDPDLMEAYFFNNKYYHFEDLADKLLESSQKSAEKESPYSEYWLSSLVYMEMTSRKQDPEAAEKLFMGYAKSAGEYMETVFRIELLNEERINLIPRQFRIGYYCREAVKAQEDGQEAKYLKYLRNALKLDQKLNDIMKTMLNSFQKKRNEVNNVKDEFNAYAAQVKAAILKMIKNGQLVQAEQFLSTYESLNPQDPDIGKLEDQIKALS